VFCGLSVVHVEIRDVEQLAVVFQPSYFDECIREACHENDTVYPRFCHAQSVTIA
jgi:hypothetical protein